MLGISQIQRQNAHTPAPLREGAYTARAVEISVHLEPHERAAVVTLGIVPTRLLDQAVADGYDDFLIAKAVRAFVTDAETPAI